MKKDFSYEDFKKLLSLAELVEDIRYDWQKEEVMNWIEKICNTFKDRKKEEVKAKPLKLEDLIKDEYEDEDDLLIDVESDLKEKDDDDDDDDEMYSYVLTMNIRSPLEINEDHIYDLTELVEDYITTQLFDLDEEDENA